MRRRVEWALEVHDRGQSDKADEIQIIFGQVTCLVTLGPDLILGAPTHSGARLSSQLPLINAIG